MFGRCNLYVSLLSDVQYAEEQFVYLPTGRWSDQRAHILLWAHEERQAKAAGYSHAALVWAWFLPWTNSTECCMWRLANFDDWKGSLPNSFLSAGIVCADLQSYPDVWIKTNKTLVFAAVSVVSHGVNLTWKSNKRGTMMFMPQTGASLLF